MYGICQTPIMCLSYGWEVLMIACLFVALGDVVLQKGLMEQRRLGRPIAPYCGSIPTSTPAEEKEAVGQFRLIAAA